VRGERIIAFAPTNGFQTAIPVSVNGPFFEVEAFGAGRHVIGLSGVVRAGAASVNAGATKTTSAFAGAQAPSQTDTIRLGAVAVKVACPAGTDQHCLVKLTLKTSQPIRVGSRSEVLTLGSATGMIAAGKSRNISVKLSAQTLQVLKSDSGELSPDAVVASRDGRGRSATRTRPIKIKEAGTTKEEPSSLY
jgi:hypothetical protein